MTATAVTIFHPTADSQGFDAWLSDVRSDAQAAPGFEAFAASIRRERLDWAVAATFRYEHQLHEWLDGDTWTRLLGEGATRGFQRLSSDLVIVEGESTPPGVAVFRHSVAAGKEAEFEDAQVKLTTASAQFPGYEGTVVFPAGPSGEWMSAIRFRTARQLTAWLESQQREEALPSLRSSLTRDFTVFSQTTPLGTTVRTENGAIKMTPSWKTAMLVLMVLYPTVMLLSRFLGPVLEEFGSRPWLTMWLSQVVSVSLLQWALMPTASARFRRWLDPVDGAAFRITVRGAALVLAVYAVTLLLFATIRWLQYWDYN